MRHDRLADTPPRMALQTLKAKLRVLDILLDSINCKNVLMTVIGWLISCLHTLVDRLDALDEGRSFAKLCHQLQDAFDCLPHTEILLIEDTPIDLEEIIVSPDDSGSQDMSKQTVWSNARSKAKSSLYWLIRASHDKRLDDDERKRARQLITQTTEPYERLTANLEAYEPNKVRYDVPLLLATKQPRDFGIIRKQWSIRLLSEVCRNHLKTLAASITQVWRVLKEIEWYKRIKHKLMSPDPLYGQRVKTLAMQYLEITSFSIFE